MKIMLKHIQLQIVKNFQDHRTHQINLVIKVKIVTQIAHARRCVLQTNAQKKPMPPSCSQKRA